MSIRRFSCALLTLVAAVAVGLPASPAVGANKDMVAAREKFFGAENVGPDGSVRSDRVILSWFSVSSFAAAFNGHVVFLDAWRVRGSVGNYVPTTTEELIDLDPEYVFIGHGDFDHAADLGDIAAGSGAKVVGSPEHCEIARSQTGDDSIPCIEAAPEGAPPGLRKELRLIPGVEISAVTHVHSSVESYEGDRTPCPPIWNAQDTAAHPPSPEDLISMTTWGTTRGANILYQFRLGDFALTWHDTSGKLEEDAPEAVKALETLPPTDVHTGPVLAFGQVTNCMRSLGQYIRVLRPKIYAANHHDNFVAVAGDNARDLEPYVRDEIERIPKKIRPQLVYTYDPDDYIRPELYTYDPSAPRWRK
ncbi:MAG TPA: MBL fold metallo-hydrolase [Actinomycetota bacterium]|nr:MBL fold metallo-hydrolase [Actinomycetota bacterium]